VRPSPFTNEVITVYDEELEIIREGESLLVPSPNSPTGTYVIRLDNNDRVRAFTTTDLEGMDTQYINEVGFPYYLDLDDSDTEMDTETN